MRKKYGTSHTIQGGERMLSSDSAMDLVVVVVMVCCNVGIQWVLIPPVHVCFILGGRGVTGGVG